MFLSQDKLSLPPLSQLITGSPLQYHNQQQQQLQVPQQYHHQQMPSPSMQHIKREEPLPLGFMPHQRTMSNSMSPVDVKPVITTQSSKSTSPKYLSKQPLDKCTCKHDGNHVPRPRNAFILFRQQHHQSVLDEGDVVKTNPDVSRELGKRWRDLEPHQKDYWNKLAEEEKKKHAEKYPGYRYIPRRFGKKGSCPFCKAKALAKQQQQQQQQNQHQFHLQQQAQAQAQAQAHHHQQLQQEAHPSGNHTSYSSTSSEEHAIAQSFLNLSNPSNYYYPHQAHGQHQPQGHGHEYASQRYANGAGYSQMAQHAPPPPHMLHHHQAPQQHQHQQHLSHPQSHSLPPSSSQQYYKRQLPSMSDRDVPRLHMSRPPEVGAGAPYTSNIRQESEMKPKCSISQLMN